MDGNLVLLNESNIQIWSTNMISTTTPASVVLHDDGNLVLRYGSNFSSPPIWQSFDHPTHTLLPGMKLLYNKRTNTKQVISSWKTIENPAAGLFSLEIDQDRKQFVVMWNRSVQYWTSGSWDGQIFSLIPEMRLNYIYKFSYVDNGNESYFTYYISDSSIISRLILDVSGQIQQMSWFESNRQWTLFWSQPHEVCDIYGGCGPFGVCNSQMLPSCNCLTGFEPRSPSDWNLGSFSDGCVRKSVLNCSFKIKKPMFVLSYFKEISLSAFPENEGQQLDESECSNACLNYCLCNAYTFISSICLHWNRESLNNISLELLSNVTYLDKTYIKVSSSDNRKNNTKVLIAGIVSGCLGLVFLCSIGVILYKRMKRQGKLIVSCIFRQLI
ncbi:putative non-specific serine/threonine protein kinase [Helianthus annuus]|nr:putative non-specific serine/threonine protein kinase [Helianthus annuus]